MKPATSTIPLLLVLILAACLAQPSDQSNMRQPTPTVASDEASNDASDAIWMQTELVDVTTGESFRLSDFAGKTVYVHPMAMW